MDAANCTSYNYSRELQSCTSMGVNCTGDLALMAGRRVLGLINLDNPGQLYSRETRQSKWDVLTCQWNNLDEDRAALASNNKVEVINVRDREICHEASLRAHTRVISDLAWHTHHREIIATSSTDAFIYIWDLRDPRRPKVALQAVAGAAKVKWNKVSGKYLATAHEGEVKLWDTRTSRSPIQYMNAHLSRIYDMDWSPDDENHLVTAGQDLTVKYWNISNPNKAENVIRLQNTPGLGQNSLTLWNNNNLVGPVHNVKVPDIILDMAWRQWPGSSKCSLITWSKDYNLRFWNIDLDLQQKCGHVVEDISEDFESQVIDPPQESDDIGGLPMHKTHSFVEIHEEEETVVIASPHSSRNNFTLLVYSSGSSFTYSISDKPMNLNYEFSLINLSDKFTIEVANPEERLFSVSAKTRRNQLVLNVKFPANYPNQVAPTFSFLEGTTIPNISRNNILQRMKNVAKQHISKNRRCLEACMRQFEQSIDQLCQSEEEQLTGNSANPTSAPSVTQPFLREITDNYVPYPRSSGARFCGDGHLVCFGLTKQYVMKIATTSNTTAVSNATDKPVETETDSSAAGGGGNKGSTEMAKTPRTLSAFYSKMPLLPSGTTSPKYSGMKVVSLMDSNNSHQDFSKSRVSRVRFNSLKTRNLSISSSDDTQVSHSSMEKRKKSSSVHHNHKQRRQLEAKVTVYDCTALMSYSRPLALKLIVPASAEAAGLSLSQVCMYNAQVCSEADRPDLQQIWSLAAVVASANKPMKDTMHPWSRNPCGRSLVTRLINHYIMAKDVQTAALLISVFGNREEYTPRVRKNNSKSESLQIDRESAFDVLTLSSTGKHNRSNSDTQRANIKLDEDDMEQLEDDMKLLDPKLNSYYNNILEFYGDLLYRWKFPDKRAEVMKMMSCMPNNEKYTSPITFFCPTCGNVMRGPYCNKCRSLSLTCCICRLPCKGLVSLCPNCGHGGHVAHLRDWFKTQVACPAACSCQCPLKMG